jgi:hypothetical protein
MSPTRPSALARKPGTLPRTVLISLVVLFVGLAAFAVDYVEQKSSETVTDLLDSRLHSIRQSLVVWSDDQRMTERLASRSGAARQRRRDRSVRRSVPSTWSDRC